MNIESICIVCIYLSSNLTYSNVIASDSSMSKEKEKMVGNI